MRKIFWVFRALCYRIFFGRIGYLSYLGKPINIQNAKRIFIGRNVRIYPNARLEVLNKESSVAIGDNVSIAQSLHVISGAELVIAKDTTISANVFITNVDHMYNEIGKHILKQEIVVKETMIGENCFIGYGVVIQAGTLLGKQCIVGANSVVRGEFPDYRVIVGSPAKIIKRYDLITNEWKKTNDKGEFSEI
jgi:acetyltransferase-like isoleucine patch superfamily enzyme